MNVLRRLRAAVRGEARPAYLVGTLEIGNPWARAASATADEAAGFFTLANTGEIADRLLAARSPVASGVTIQAIKVVGSGMTMRALDKGLAVPAATRLTLQPRGYHLLLAGFRAPIGHGARLPVTLTFERAGEVGIELVVGSEGPIGNAALVEIAQPG